MPNLHTLGAYKRRDQKKTNLVLTPETVSAVAKVLIKSALYEDFASLVQDASTDSVLLQAITPYQVKKAAKNLSEQGGDKWGSFVQLVCAIQSRQDLLTVIRPNMIREATSALVDVKKDYGRFSYRDFSELAMAVSSQPRLLKGFMPAHIAMVAQSFAENVSCTHRPYSDSPDYIKTHHNKEIAEAFGFLARAVKHDDLCAAINPVAVGKVALAFFGLGQGKVDEYQTDQGYGVEVPNGFAGFQAFASYIDGMADAPEAWKNAASDAICGLLQKGIDGRSMPYVAKILRANAWVMDADQFKDAVRNQPNTSCMGNCLYHMKDVESLKAAYPEATRTYIASMMRDSGELHIRDEAISYLGEDVLAALRELVANLAGKQDYAAVSRVLQRWSEEKITQAMQDELARHDLYSVWFDSGDRKDQALNAVMHQRRSLDIVFRKIAGDAVICADPAEEFHGYTFTQRLPRDVVGPVKALADVEATAPADLVPAIRLGFARAADGSRNVPEWVRNIARSVLNPAPAPDSP